MILEFELFLYVLYPFCNITFTEYEFKLPINKSIKDNC